MMNTNSILACRVVFVVVLLLGFSLLFGYPAFTKFLESAVFIQISTDPPDRGTIKPVTTPAITFCPSHKNSPLAKGWKNASDGYMDIINIECKQPKSLDEAISCMKNRTYSFTETILHASRGATISKPLVEQKFWRSDITAMQAGQCHTLNYPEPVGSRLETNILFFLLNPELSYDVVIHDPVVYLHSLTPSAVPQIKIKKKPSEEARNFDLIYITMTKHIKINRPGFPCNESENYKFRTCVKESVSKKIGCRMEWDVDSEQGWPLCTTMEQLR